MSVLIGLLVMGIVYSNSRDFAAEAVLKLYRALNWSSAEKAQQLIPALQGSDSIVTAWDGEKLVGLGNAISDGHLVVYYPNLAVHPDYQRRGIGRSIVDQLMSRYEGFHQQMVVADGQAVEFYRKLGFQRAGDTEPMWIFDGDEH